MRPYSLLLFSKLVYFKVYAKYIFVEVKCYRNSCSQRVIATFWTHFCNETLHLMKQVRTPMWKIANILRGNAIWKKLIAKT